MSTYLGWEIILNQIIKKNHLVTSELILHVKSTPK